MPYPKRDLICHPESDCTFWDTWSESHANAGALVISTANLRAGELVSAGIGYSTVMPDMDFETYSEAGYWYDEDAGRWRKIDGAPTGATNGLAIVGAACYAEHLSTELLSLAYDLKDGHGKRLWVPGCPPPADLFDHIARGGLLEAWNSPFEYLIWLHVCDRKMNWPPLDFRQLRDAMAKSLAFSLPAALKKCGDVLNTEAQKIDDGTRLLNKFSKPRNPTKADARLRLLPSDDPVDGPKLYEYNLADIGTEAELSAHCPDLSPDELQLWLLDQEIIFHGCAIDVDSVKACRALVRETLERGNAEVFQMTGGAVKTIGQRDEILRQLEAWGESMPNMQEATVTAALEQVREDPSADPRAVRLLELRSLLGSASVKKLNSIDLRTSVDGRLRGLFQFAGADRTGRWAGRGPQPQNLPNSGPSAMRCDPVSGCGRHYRVALDNCPWCSTPGFASERVDWNVDAVEDALRLAREHPQYLNSVIGDPISVISACLRGLFVSAGGYDLLCSDYSAIEAVVLAALAGEEWRLEVFRTHGKIYEMSAAKVTGIPFEDMMAHAGYTDLTVPLWWTAKQTGEHHPTRKKIGKVAELASGYQGGLGAWRAFGADKFMTDEEIKEAVKVWRRENPAIVRFWYKLEDAARAAIKSPGQCFEYRGLTFGVKDDVLFCRLLSGRTLSYHRPRLVPDRTPWGKEVEKITYEGTDSYTKKWCRLETYGGKLAENVTQATARDILAHALVNARAAGYMPVLHVHDEIVAEVPEGWGSIEEFERIMATMPTWASDWPIRAAGGWRGKRYRKD